MMEFLVKLKEIRRRSREKSFALKVFLDFLIFYLLEILLNSLDDKKNSVEFAVVFCIFSWLERGS